MEIFIIGRQFFANELLLCFLTHQMPNCRLTRVEQLDDFNHDFGQDAERKILFLCDCKSFSPNYFLDHPQSFYLQRKHQTMSLFYNLERDLGLEAEVIRRGVQGVLFAEDKPETMLKAINKLLSGQLWASRQALSECLRPTSGDLGKGKDVGLKKLTPRECQILGLVAEGSSNVTIADYLCISRHTVKTHLYNIFRKINVPNRVKAGRWAEQHLPIV